MSAKTISPALKSLLAVILPGLTVFLLIAYAHLGASRGHYLFTFLLNTTLGNVLLATAASLCAYNVFAALTGISGASSVAEEMHSLLLVLVLSLVTYPFAVTLTGGPASLPLALLLSVVLALPIVVRKLPKIIETLYFIASASFIAAALLDGRVARSFDEVCRLIAELEQLLKGLGLS